jgi:hypothetical protein
VIYFVTLVTNIGWSLSPSGIFNGISDSNPEVIFDYVAGALNRFGLAYLHVIEPRVKVGETLREGHPPVAAARLRKIFNAPMIVAGGFDREGAMEVLDKGDADLVAFGRHFIANPDLVERFRLGLPLNRYDRSTFYSPGPKGYIDYANFHQGRNLWKVAEAKVWSFLVSPAYIFYVRYSHFRAVKIPAKRVFGLGCGCLRRVRDRVAVA